MAGTTTPPDTTFDTSRPQGGRHIPVRLVVTVVAAALALAVALSIWATSNGGDDEPAPAREPVAAIDDGAATDGRGGAPGIELCEARIPC